MKSTIAAFAAVAALLCACGDKDESTGPSTTETQQTTDNAEACATLRKKSDMYCVSGTATYSPNTCETIQRSQRQHGCD